MKTLYESSAYSVFNNFERISQIPRCSNDEERISEFMYNFGLELGLETTKDESGNVLIIKEATEGYENHDAVILQSHLDMVCEKTEDSNHNFKCDPIELSITDGYLHANNTTLGADDGIGVALVMAILEAKDIEHPRIEAIFTTTEETGMNGAFGLSKDLLKGKNLINIDNEEDNMIIVGCAGGVGAYLEHKLIRKECSNEKTSFQIKVSGLRGGHSGTMIRETRANAIKILNSILLKLKSTLHYCLSKIEGGSKHNAIPSFAKAIISVKNDNLELLNKEFNNIVIEVNDKYLRREVDIDVKLEQIEGEYSYIDDEIAKEILNSLEMFPHGVNTMDKELDIVRSSNNLAIVRTEDDLFKIQTSIRSTFEEDFEFLKNSVSNIAKNFDYSIEFSEGYPMWVPNFDNTLLDTAKKAYKDLKNEDVGIAVIHAGLETGILSEKYPDVNMISIGPNIFDAHTPKEKLSLKSTEFTFKYLKRIIKNL